MAIKQIFLIVALIAVVLPSLTLAAEYTVEDGAGWTTKFSYTEWAKDKTFTVGDKLVFKYPVGAHNVFKVNATTFQDCAIPQTNDALTSGNDVITLAAPGKKWYICGVAQHCKLGGQKLVINVMGSAEPAPAPTNSAEGLVKSIYLVLSCSSSRPCNDNLSLNDTNYNFNLIAP